MASEKKSQWQVITDIEKFIGQLLYYILDYEAVKEPISFQVAAAFYLGFSHQEGKKVALYVSPQGKLQPEHDRLLAELELPEGILINELLGLACARLDQMFVVYCLAAKKNFWLRTEFREGGLLVKKVQR